MQVLLLERQLPASQGPPDRGQAAPEAAPLPELFQRGVGLLADQFVEPLLVARPQGRGRGAAVRLGVQRPGGATPPEQAGDEREADAERRGDLALGALAVIDGRRDPFPKVDRIGAHGSSLRLRGPVASQPSPPRELYLSATRE